MTSTCDFDMTDRRTETGWLAMITVIILHKSMPGWPYSHERTQVVGTRNDGTHMVKWCLGWEWESILPVPWTVGSNRLPVRNSDCQWLMLNTPRRSINPYKFNIRIHVHDLLENFSTQAMKHHEALRNPSGTSSLVTGLSNECVFPTKLD